MLVEIDCGVARTVNLSEDIYSMDAGMVNDSAQIVEQFEADVLVVVNSHLFLEIAAKETSSAVSILNGSMKVHGKGNMIALKLNTIMDYFDDPCAEIEVPL
jgi:hypothetical protein